MVATERGCGDVIVLSAPGGTLVLPEGADDHLAGRLRQALLDADSLGAVVDALTASGVQGLPSFCGAFPRGSQCRVLVRGSGVASVSIGDGSSIDVVARFGMTTWREEIFDDVGAVALRSNASPRPVIEVLLGPAIAHAQPADVVGAPRPAPELRTDPTATSAAPSTSGPIESRPHPDLTLVAPCDPADADPEPDHVPPAYGPTEELEPIAPRSSAADEPEFDFSHLLEHTQFRGAEAAAVRPPEPTADEPAPGAGPVAATPKGPASVSTTAASPALGGLIDGIPSGASAGVVSPPPPSQKTAPEDGDHDGFTIAASALRSIVGSQAAQPASPPSPVGGIQAVFCVVGHPNPPHASQCRACGGAIVDRRVRSIARPALGRLRFSSGAVVELDRPQLIGRRPTVDPARPASELPALVTVPDPDEAVSRVHAEVRLEGWEVFVVDRGSKNGTFVEIPGQAPTKLRAGEPCLIVAGTKVTLADVSTFEFDVGGP